jgi:hypothetical protein
VTFDHSASVAGPGSPGVTCGDADQQICIGYNKAVLNTLRGEGAPFQVQLGDVKAVTWNAPPQGACSIVPVRATTWGKLKSIYH